MRAGEQPSVRRAGRDKTPSALVEPVASCGSGRVSTAGVAGMALPVGFWPERPPRSTLALGIKRDVLPNMDGWFRHLNHVTISSDEHS